MTATSRLVPLPPCRLLDTRVEAPGRLQPGGTVEIGVIGGRCGVPADATAVALTFTVTNTANAGYLTGFPAGDARPNASILNWRPGIRTIANTTILPLGVNGRIAVYSEAATHLIIDVTGYFVTAATATMGRFIPLVPKRLIDTRQGGRPAPNSAIHLPVPDGVPTDAVAVTATLTTTRSSGPGFFTAWPSGPMPETSSLNTDNAGQTRAVGQIIPIANNGFNVFSSAGDHIIIDITGYFTGPSAPESSDGLFTPTTPVRLLDTRRNPPRLKPPDTREIDPFPITGNNVAAVATNWTVTDPNAPGYVTAYPARTPRPVVSNVNFDPATLSTVASFGYVPTSTAGVAAFAEGGTELIVDLSGWFSGQPMSTSIGVQPIDPPGSDPLRIPWSPNSGAACATGLQAEDLTAYFGAENAGLYGADYQRAFKLPDGRVLWMFQDGFVRRSNGDLKLVHNVGLLQSGNCFTLLRSGTAADPGSWLMWDRTRAEDLWYWPMGGETDPNGQTFHLLMAEMDEVGSHYLDHVIPRQMWLVDIRLSDMRVTGVSLAPNPSDELYGFAATSDAAHTYLYSHCYKQFGFSSFPGHDACTRASRVGRVPRGRLDVTPEYWDGATWQGDPGRAAEVFNETNTGRGANPLSVMWDGQRFRLVTQPDDWWGNTILFFSSANPFGPWTLEGSIAAPKKCDTDCKTYYPSWVPWRNNDGSLIWGLSHNVWPPAISPVYRPTFHRH